MIEVEEARLKIQHVLSKQNRVETIPILEAAGRVCGEDVFAKIAIPHFPRAGMDGYAVCAEETKGASLDSPVSLNVIGTVFAGDTKQQKISSKGTAVKIMTGAMIPSLYDAVIKQEWTNYGKNEVKIYHEIEAGSNYGFVGEDVYVGQKIISKYTLINSRTVGILAAQGIMEINVLLPIKIGILATGNELISFEAQLTSGKIYDSNLYTLASFMQSSNATIIFKKHCCDEIEDISHFICERINDVDLLITTGGVSVGEKDFIPTVIKQLGGELLFHFVNMKPGTPVMASLYKNQVILSLSGNPFASVVNLHLFFWSILAYFMNCAELNLKKREVRLAEELNQTTIRRFVRAYEENGVVFVPSKVHYSSVFYNTLETNCLIDQPAKKKLKKDDLVRIYYWKD